jgi:hypothetical protein
VKRGDTVTADQQRGNQEPVDIIAIYRNDIELTEAEYLDRIPEGLIYSKSNVFLGLLEEIYQNVLSKNIIKKDSYNNDYTVLNEIFYKVYLPIVYKYGYTPSLYMFAAFVHTSDTYLAELMSGVYHDGSRVKNETSETVRKWYNTCKAATVTRAIDGNSIGAIFAAKAAYQMSDQPQPAPMAIKEDPLPPVEEVEARYLQPPKID